MEALLRCEIRRGPECVASGTFQAPLPGSPKSLQESREVAIRLLLGREPLPGEFARFEVAPDKAALWIDGAFDSLIEAAENAGEYPLANAAVALRTAWSRGSSLDAARALLEASGARR